ncbi:MAG: dipeptidase [Chthoniobacterales bacterium]|nr:dipeptidase [Chthoniobacterales bacterium]
MSTPLDPITTLVEYLHFPSISTQPEHAKDLVACAEWLAGLFKKMGLTATIHQTAGHPILVAKTIPDPQKKTVLIYGHYDVQPPEPLEEWTSSPFEPRIDEKEGKIYARGSSDNKAPTLAHILGVAKTLQEKGTLPVNVIFLIEGEEEIGSPHLDSFLQEHRQELSCDVVVISDTGMAPGNLPAITYALRGVAAMEFIVRGPACDLHSGLFGGAVANPLTVAARLIASLHDEHGHILIPGFYDTVASPEPWEQEATKALEKASGGDASIKKLAGVEELFGEAGFSTLERIGSRPTAEVNGFGGGYQGAGTKTVLPKEAFVKLSFRLVANQDPKTVLEQTASYLRTQLPPGVSLKIIPGHYGEACFIDPESPNGKAAQEALAETFGTPPLLLRDGASIPIVTHFKKIFDVDVLLLGLANPDCGMHSPNENILLENFLNGIRLSEQLLKRLSQT